MKPRRHINIILIVLCTCVGQAVLAQREADLHDTLPAQSAPNGSAADSKKEDMFLTPHFLMLPGAVYSNANEEQSIAIDLSVLWRIHNKSKMLVGAQISRLLWISLLNVDPQSRYELTSYAPGIKFANRLHRNVYFTMSVAAVMGNEIRLRTLTNQYNWIATRQKLFAPCLTAGLLVPVPAHSRGVYFGAELFHRNSTGTLLKKVMGFRASLGFRL